jgi:general secretion pathway protein B
MSFILDALKKSESDRQRQSGPALFEVKVTPPKPRFPYWALALATLLVINIVIGAWVFLHRPASVEAPLAQAAAPPPATTAPSATAPVSAEAPASHTAPAASLAPPSAAPPSAAPPAAAPPASAASHPEPVLSNAESKDAPLNPDDYEPAVAAGKQDQELRGGHVKRGTESGLVSYADAAANPDLHLPAVRIDLHVYAANPQERFVLINMHRLHEGDALPEGLRVESITPEGAIVSYRGSKFFLEHQ